MTARVKKIAEQVMALPQDEREEFLSWLADFEAGDSDDWDKDIARDSQPGGRLEGVLERVRKDIAEGRTAYRLWRQPAPPVPAFQEGR